jgi:hypothetical protein
VIRRVRAAVALGLTWSVPWAVAGVALITWRFLAFPRPDYSWRDLPGLAMTGALILGACGFVAGFIFAITLLTTADGRTLDELSLGYAVRWGGIAGAISIATLPLLGFVTVPALLVGGALFAIVGSGSAAATLSVARRATAPAKVPPSDNLRSSLSDRGQPNDRST